MIFFVDTETGGTNPTYHSLLEVGMAALRGDEIVGTLQFYIKRDAYVVTGTAMNINKLDLYQVEKNGLNPNIAVARICQFVRLYADGGKDDILAGHNVDFDRRFLQSIFFEVGMNIDDYLSHRTLDTASIIRFSKEIGRLSTRFPNGMHDAARALGYEPNAMHTVAGDIETNIWLYKQLVNLYTNKQGG